MREISFFESIWVFSNLDSYDEIFSGETPLHIASMVGNVENIRLLLNNGAEEHACERKRGANALHQAVLFGHLPAVHFLVLNVCI